MFEQEQETAVCCGAGKDKMCFLSPGSGHPERLREGRNRAQPYIQCPLAEASKRQLVSNLARGGNVDKSPMTQDPKGSIVATEEYKRKQSLPLYTLWKSLMIAANIVWDHVSRRGALSLSSTFSACETCRTRGFLSVQTSPPPSPASHLQDCHLSS